MYGQIITTWGLFYNIIILLSGKTLKCTIYHPGALINRTSGFSFPKVSPPLIKQARFWRRFLCVLNHLCPIPFGVFKKSIAVYIIHEHDSYHCCQSGKAPGAFYALLYDHQKKVGYECDPNLYFDGVGTFTIEVSQREVLL